MYSETDSPARRAAALIFRCSSLEMRGLSVSESLLFAGFGGLPIRFFMDLLYPQKLESQGISPGIFRKNLLGLKE